MSAGGNARFAELMAVAPSDHDMKWLERSLQIALQLELYTIPPYLCAYWSIRNRLDPVARSIREIIREEMLHLGLVCNLLVSIDSTPRLNAADVLPKYPCALPAGIDPNTSVHLQGLCRPALEEFVEIERPSYLRPAGRFGGDEKYPTIGDFYHAISTAFCRLTPLLQQSRQLYGPLGLQKLGSLSDVMEAVALIVHQGEGSDTSPEEAPTDLAHYFRFREILIGRRLVKDPISGTWSNDGPAIPFPAARQMGKVPAGGYSEASVSPEVWKLIVQFDQIFSRLLDQLQLAWENGDSGALAQAMVQMFLMDSPAVALMEIPIPNSAYTYGPCFIYGRPATILLS